MSFNNIGRLIGRGLAAIVLVAAVSLTSTGTAYARHGNGAGIALGIIGGVIAGAAIASAGAPPYYAAPPAYYSPYAPQAYPAPQGYYYAPPTGYYGPTPYYGSQYYSGGY